MRLTIRLAVLGLAAYGAYTLYEQYGRRLQGLGGPMRDFSARASNATSNAVNDVSSATADAVHAVKESAVEVEQAAVDARDQATRTLDASGTSAQGA